MCRPRARLGCAALSVGLVAGLLGCPRPVAEASPAPNPQARTTQPSLMPNDVTLVIEADHLGKAQRALTTIFDAFAGEGALLEELDRVLELPAGLDARKESTLRLAGLDPERPVRVGVRPDGSIITLLPLIEGATGGRKRFRTAIETVLGAQSIEAAPSLGPQTGLASITAWRAEGELKALSRIFTSPTGPVGALLANPTDALAQSVMLAHLEEPGVSMPETELARALAAADPARTATARLWTPRFSPLEMETSGALRVRADDRVVLDALVAGGAPTTAPSAAPGNSARRTAARAPLFCAAQNLGGAVLLAELPAAWVPDDDARGADRWQGPALLAIFERRASTQPVTLDDPFSLGSLVFSARPTSETAAQDLLRSFTEAVPEADEIGLVVEGRSVRRLLPKDVADGGLEHRILDAVTDAELFVLTSGGGPLLGRLLAEQDRLAGLGGEACPPTAARAHLELDAAALSGLLANAPARAPGAGEPSPTGALLRLLARATARMKSASVTVEEAPSGQLVHAEVQLLRR